MSRSNYDKPFYVDVGTSVVAIRCASNHDVIFSKDHHGWKASIELAEKDCDRMNKEFELYAKSKVEATKPTCDWSVKDALAFANTLANHGWTRDANADAASSCVYALCRMLKDGGNAAAMREALKNLVDVIDRCASSSPLWWHSGAQGVIPLKNAKAALSLPPRNCDVGTVEEQDVRYCAFCYKMLKQNNHCCGPCPCYKFVKGEALPCTLLWSQMPYESEERQ